MPFPAPLDTTAFLSSAAPALTGIHVGSFTIAFWLNPEAGGLDQSLVIDRAWHIILNSDDTITFTILDSVTSTETSVTTSEAVVLNDWNHVAVVYNVIAQTISIYLNNAADFENYTNEADDSTGTYSTVFQLGHTA